MSFFADVESIEFEGPETDNPLAFRHYQPDREIHGKTMAEHLRFATCYWHSFAAVGDDVFGDGTWDRPWTGDLAGAHAKLEAAFEFFAKLGVPFYCFHDRDVAPEGSSHAETARNLQVMGEALQAAQERTGTRLLWGTANLFSHPRYAAGAATNPDPMVFALAADQVRQALDLTRQLGGQNYVLWGGREGYDTLLNTDLRQELQQLGRFMSMVAEHKAKIGFEGTLLIEPKPCEPTKHQYDYDSGACLAFLQKFGLEREFKLNIECNHATLAGHSFHHEVAYAIANDVFGSVDANRGDPQNGWDTDQFPNNVDECTLVLYEIIKSGGFDRGGFNFDAKLRRQSVDRSDLFHGHIGGMDTLALALTNAFKLLDGEELMDAVCERYNGWRKEFGSQLLSGQLQLSDMAGHLKKIDPNMAPASGRQEYLENLVSRCIH